jgi:hypothetical protein
MRRLRLLGVFLAVGLFAAAAIPAVAARHATARCSVPRGWRLVAQDHQAVIDRQRNQRNPAYDYCHRAVGKWHSTVATGSMENEGTIYALRLAGRFVAYQVNSDLWLWDTRNGLHNETTDGVSIGAFSAYLLSPDGVVARFADILPTNVHPPGVDLETLSIYSYELEPAQIETPDATSLQLFNCAIGCQPNTVLVTWTDQAGQAEYKQVTGGD